MSSVPKPGYGENTRSAELENSRMGVIYFLGNLQVDFSAETSLKDNALKLLGSKAGAAAAVANIVGGALDPIADKISQAIQAWLVNKFHFSASDADLAVQAVGRQLPSLISGIHDEIGKTAKDFVGHAGALDIGKGLYTAITKGIEVYDLHTASKGVKLESGHPDIIATSIQRSVTNSALKGLAEAAVAGAKFAFAAFTGGAGLVINKIAGVIEQILKFAVRFCDARALRKVFADARQKWECRGQSDAIQARAGEFADWFKKTIDQAPVVAALVMNCGIAGDAMRFLQVVTSPGVVVTQGQFDKGVTYLNKLKSSATDLIIEIQADMTISSKDPMTAALLKQAAQIGLVQKEANSSWRAKIFAWSNQGTTKSKVLNWALDKAGYKQSTPFGR